MNSDSDVNAPVAGSGPRGSAELWIPVPTGTSSEIHCPNCNVPLAFGMILEHKIACCDKCGGMLFQRANLGRAVSDMRSRWTSPDETPEPMDSRQLQIKRMCPVCFGEMVTFPYCGPGNTVIDACDGCDITWLDGGELQRLVKAPGLRKPWAAPVTSVYGNENLRGPLTAEEELEMARWQSATGELGGPVSAIAHVLQHFFR